MIITERRKEEDYDEEVEEDLQDEVQLNVQIIGLFCVQFFIIQAEHAPWKLSFLSLSISL